MINRSKDLSLYEARMTHYSFRLLNGGKDTSMIDLSMFPEDLERMIKTVDVKAMRMIDINSKDKLTRRSNNHKMASRIISSGLKHISGMKVRDEMKVGPIAVDMMVKIPGVIDDNLTIELGEKTFRNPKMDVFEQTKDKILQAEGMNLVRINIYDYDNWYYQDDYTKFIRIFEDIEKQLNMPGLIKALGPEETIK